MRDSSKLIAVGRGMPSINKSEVRIYSSVGEVLLIFTVSFRDMHSWPILMMDSETKARLSGLDGHMTSDWRFSTKKGCTECTICRVTTDSFHLGVMQERWVLSMHGSMRTVWSL